MENRKHYSDIFGYKAMLYYQVETEGPDKGTIHNCYLQSREIDFMALINACIDKDPDMTLQYLEDFIYQDAWFAYANGMDQEN